MNKNTITAQIRPIETYSPEYLKQKASIYRWRADNSDNLIHWHYSLLVDGEELEVFAHSFRITVILQPSLEISEAEFISLVRNDFKNYGKKMTQVRLQMEDWVCFLNPYKQLDSSLGRLMKRAKELVLKCPDNIPQPKDYDDFLAFQFNFRKYAPLIDEAVGLCQSIRMLAPVCAESFLNLIIALLIKPKIKEDEKRYTAYIRSHIDERVKGLHLNCMGFRGAIDWSNQACRDFNSLMNRRNDLLHGNVLPMQNFHERLYFYNRTVPIFREWRGFYDRCFGAKLKAFSVKDAESDLAIALKFREYIISCMEPSVIPWIEQMVVQSELGYNVDNKRMGVLLPETLVDGMMASGNIEFPDCGAGI